MIQKVPHALLRPGLLDKVHEMRFIAPFLAKTSLPRWIADPSEDSKKRKGIKDKQVLISLAGCMLCVGASGSGSSDVDMMCTRDVCRMTRLRWSSDTRHTSSLSAWTVCPVIEMSATRCEV